MLKDLKLPRRNRLVDVAVVGAGPAGIGVACALQDAGIDDLVVVERGRVGESLRSWPRETRCITPSFQANAFGAVDLNAISPSTSPSFSLDVEHPSGAEWARYLVGVAEHFELPVREGVTVHAVHALGHDDGFVLETSERSVRARLLVWAGGEFGAPRTGPFAGADLCRHVSTIRSFAEVTEREVVVVGGFESGIDAAVALISRPDRKVTVIDSSKPWERRFEDPSVMLSPHSRGRLDQALATGRLTLRGDADVAAVSSLDGGRVCVSCTDGSELAVSGSPVLATGYRPVLGPVEHLLERDEQGMPLLDSSDQSTVVPGLFLAGPALRHDDLIFCFAYKYRGRFPVVAGAIAAQLGREPAAELGAWRAAGMHLDDLSCCGEACAC